jgi:DNA-binding SARP family transcriptional activator
VGYPSRESNQSPADGARVVETQAVSHLRVGLLGGFRVNRDDLLTPITQWQRRSAKTLMKLLATAPGHALHREQVLDLLWPGSSLDSALNSFGKALHAARRALHPGLPPRQPSPYLLLVDSMVAFDPAHVAVDADHFERVARDALRQREVSALESALAAYRGDLLPEDRYADWCAQRRDFLSDLRVRLLLEMADLLEAQGAYNESADRLRTLLQQDPTREDVHRRLMRLYTEMGTPDQAVRQFHACEEALQRELDFVPQEETVAAYHDVLAHRTSQPKPSSSPAGGPASPDPFVGRTEIVSELCGPLRRPTRRAGLVLVTGEAGVGKTRLLEEVAKCAARQDAAVFWGGAGAPGTHLACGPFAVALEGYVAARPLAERRELARRYPPLTGFVPSLVTETQAVPVLSTQGDHGDVVPAIVRLLTDTAREHPVLLVVDDLLQADGHSLDIIGYLAHLAIDGRWLMVASVGEQEVEPGTAVSRLLGTAMREGLCRKLELQCLSRTECHELVSAMLPSASVSRELLDQIYERSRGNPMFARELAQDARALVPPRNGGSGASRAQLIAGRVPTRVRMLAEMQLTALDSTTQRVLLLAAAAGDKEVSFSHLRMGAAALDPPVGDGALLDALDRAVETRLLDERQHGYTFRHPLVQSALYERLSHHRRAQLGGALRNSSGCA